MNRLQLCQRTGVECGVSGTITTSVGNVGSWGRICNWVDDAWNEIQTRYDDWDWMRSSNLLGSGASFATVAGQASYPLGTGAGTVGVATDSFGKWDKKTFRNYTTTVGVSNEMFLDDIDFDSWRDSYMLGAMRSVQTRPVAVAIGPNQSVCLGPPPNALYTITADYFLPPAVMTLDADLPTGLPLRFHMLIVYTAMFKYAGFESAPDVYARATADFKPMMGQLEAVRAVQMAWGA